MKSFRQLYEKAKQNNSYWVEQAKLEFSIELNRVFKKSGKTQKELAESIGTSQAYITKVFRGDSNFTIETMVKLSRAVGGQIHIHIAPQNAKANWIDVIDSQQSQELNPSVIDWQQYVKNQNERITYSA